MAHPNEGKTFVGEVKFFDASKGKGWGFILCPEASESEVFVHLMYIRGEGYKALKPTEKVQFVLAYDEQNRPQAHDVVVVEKAVSRIDGAIIAREIRAVISTWDEERHSGFVNELSQFGGKGVYVCLAELDDEETSLDLTKGTTISLDVMVSKSRIGEIGLRAINVKIIEGPRPAHIVMKTEVKAVMSRFDREKRRGFAETIGEEPAMRVFVSAKSLATRADEARLAKGVNIVLDVCEGDEGPYGINIRLASNGKTTMEAAFEAAANGKTKGDVSPTEALHAADEVVKTDRNKRRVTA